MRKTQTSIILDYLREVGDKGITSMDAFELCGATRLSSLIFSLRKQGYVITSEDITTINRFGNSCTYSKYVLVSEPKEDKHGN